MKRTAFYSNEMEKAIDILFFQSDTERYNESLKLIQDACSRGEADAFYLMMRCYTLNLPGLSENISLEPDYVKKGIRLGSDICVLEAASNDIIGALKDELLHSPQVSVYNVKEMALAGNVMAQYVLGKFYLEDGVEKCINHAYYFTEDYPEKNNPDFLTHLKVNSEYNGMKWMFRAAKQGCLPASDLYNVKKAE